MLLKIIEHAHFTLFSDLTMIYFLFKNEENMIDI